MKYFSIWIIICCVIFPFNITGQINGKVLDENKEPLADVYITNRTSDLHTHSDYQGTFKIKGNIGDTLEIVHLGYESQMQVVTDTVSPVIFNLNPAVFELDQVVVSNQVRLLHSIALVDLNVNAVNSSQEILRKVPGLFIGQHAGGGKAEQIFLRGFDIDHGTDLAIAVDGIPVNMVSHAHGQGYADLHFLIPETIGKIDFDKGPYYSDKGNFATAGYVNFQTFDKPPKSLVTLEYGSFNTLRTVGLFDLLKKVPRQNAYIAGEYYLTDGPFDAPQNFNRINIMAKYTGQISENTTIGVLGSVFSSKWDASGQIPQRTVESGHIGRFGAIDNTEGGQTKRINAALNFTHFFNSNTYVKGRFYYTRYQFELYSNFTFALRDSVNGDQIRQKETRNLTGFETRIGKYFYRDALDIIVEGGLGLRYDQVNDNELSYTKNRLTTLDTVSLGDINESNIYAYADVKFEFKRWTVNTGLRIDYFKFDYYDKLLPEYQTQSEEKPFFSPKLNVIYAPLKNWQLFLKSGIGFHSNDTRVVVAQNGRDILPLAVGVDLGTTLKPLPKMVVTLAGWFLFLEDEFVYVGDEGIVEPSGKTRRLGIDFSIDYKILSWLFVDAEFNYANARSIEHPESGDYIPLAPVFTSTGGIAVRHHKGFAGALRYRYMHDRPADENYSVTAGGYFVVDFDASYTYKRILFGIKIDNLFNTDWNEAQFLTTSRLPAESMPTEEIHFTPGTPFSISGKLGFIF